MKLSNEQFERIVGLPAPVLQTTESTGLVLPSGSRTVDRRQAVRIPFGRRARVQMDRDVRIGVWDTILLLDISVQGISFMSGQWLTQDESFVLNLRDHQNQLVGIRCTVCRCERGGHGGASYMVGALFDELVPATLREDALEQNEAPAPQREPVSLETFLASGAPVVVSPAASAGNVGRQIRGVLGSCLLSLLRSLNPLEIIRAIRGRNYDDYSTCTLGSQWKPGRTVIASQK